MAAEKVEFPVKTMACLLGISRSGFCSWLSLGEPEDPWAEVRPAVERCWLESDWRFGTRSVRVPLPDYDNDIDESKAVEPWLFSSSFTLVPAGTTGCRHQRGHRRGRDAQALARSPAFLKVRSS